jgi:hypothetical protein
MLIDRPWTRTVEHETPNEAGPSMHDGWASPRPRVQGETCSSTTFATAASGLRRTVELAFVVSSREGFGIRDSLAPGFFSGLCARPLRRIGPRPSDLS